MFKSSQYSTLERAKWLRMWAALAGFLRNQKLPILVDITFHKELNSLPDNFLETELLPKLKLVVTSSVVVDNPTWTVSVRFIRMEDVRRAQGDMLLKLGSPLLREVVVGRQDSAKGCTIVIQAPTAPENPTYVDDIQFAAGAVWYCDAPRAVRAKARHIKKHVAEATKQLPDGELGVIHVGLESHDGAIVESARFERIKEELRGFDPHRKMLAFIYVHSFDPRVTPESPWDFGEAVAWLSQFDPGFEPLEHPQLVVPADGEN